MTALILIFGIVTAGTGVAILINPAWIQKLIRQHHRALWIQVFAIAARLLLGLLLIYYSETSKYPTLMSVLGWLSLLAAATFAIVGRRNFVNMMTWVLAMANPVWRVGGSLAAAFGALLVYAFI